MTFGEGFFNMRILVLFMLLLSTTVLTNCGAVKRSEAYNNRSPIEVRDAAMASSMQDTEHYYGRKAQESVYMDEDEGMRVVTSTSIYKPMFSSRKHIGGNPITSKPMFTSKNGGTRWTDKFLRKMVNAVGGGDQTWPDGYHGPSRVNMEARKYDTNPQVKLKKPATNDMNADRILSSISGDRYIPPLGSSYNERRMLDKIYEPMDYPSDRYKILESDDDGEVFVSGEVAEQVFFGHASSKVRNKNIIDLNEFADDVTSSDQRYKVSVVGHASKRVDGNKSVDQRKTINYRIAERRARAVKNQLRKAGVDSGMVVAVSKGDAEPNPYPGDRSQEDSDRRVDIYLDDLYYYY